MYLEDFERMLVDDCDFGLTSDTVRRCFSLSQMTVVNETDEKGAQKYNYVLYVEFLEAIARIAHFIFEGTEQEDGRLAMKLEIVLEMLFKQILKQGINKNIVVIEEFSDSDSDY